MEKGTLFSKLPLWNKNKGITYIKNILNRGNYTMILKLLFILFGVVLVLWGIYRMKTDEAFIGKTQTRKNIFNFFILGETAGLGQFLSGIACVIIGILSFIIK